MSEAARTRTSTCPGPGVGSGLSTTARFPNPNAVWMTSAFTATSGEWWYYNRATFAEIAVLSPLAGVVHSFHAVIRPLTSDYRLMDSSDSLKIDENLARFLAAYDQGIDGGGDAGAITMHIGPPAGSGPPVDSGAPPTSGR